MRKSMRVVSPMWSYKGEYSTHWEKILCFVWFYSITKWYIYFNSSWWYFIIICVFGILSLLSIMLRYVLMMVYEFSSMFMRLRNEMCIMSFMMS
jgi:hypothetical protein